MHAARSNLSASWVATVVAQGWAILPLYVGPQAPCWGGGGVVIDPDQAAAQGTAAADDAVIEASVLGIAPGSSIFYDMESYGGNSACLSAVETFLSASTAELFAQSYLPGVYGSACSTIANLAGYVGNSNYHTPNAIWFADWSGTPSVNHDPAGCFSDGLWTNHQRIHQYVGGHDETYGGVTIDIDNDYDDTTAAQLGTPRVNIVVDNSDAGFSRTGSGWSTNTTGSFYGPNMYYVANQQTTATAGGKWSTTITQAGLWEVEVTDTSNHATTTNAQYQVTSGSGRPPSASTRTPTATAG